MLDEIRKLKERERAKCERLRSELLSALVGLLAREGLEPPGYPGCALGGHRHSGEFHAVAAAFGIDVHRLWDIFAEELLR